MGSILDDFKKEYEKSKEDNNFDLPEGVKLNANEIEEYNEYLKKYKLDEETENNNMMKRKSEFLKSKVEKEEIDKINNDIDFDVEEDNKQDKELSEKELDLMKRIKENLPDGFDFEKIDENDDRNPESYKVFSDDEFRPRYEKVITSVKHAYCPVCGEEIVCNGPTMYNPMTMEPASFYKCPHCDTKIKLDASYPKIVYLDKNGKEIIAYN